MHPNQPRPDTNPPAERSDAIFLSVPAILATIGLSVLIFAPGPGRAFGIAIVTLALATPLRPRAESTLQRACAGAIRYSSRHARRLNATLKASGVLAGLAMFGAAWRLSALAPVPDIPVFLAASASLLLLCLAVDSRNRPHWLERLSTGLAILAIAASLAGAIGFVAQFSGNYPFFDEYMSTLPMVSAFRSWDWSTLTTYLASPHFSHRIVSTRLLAIADFYAAGRLNFVHLIWMSFAFLLGTAVLVQRSLPQALRRPLLFAPFIVLLLNPQYHQLTLWGFSIQHFSSLFFAAASFASLAAGPRWLLPAVLAFFAASYSFAIGVFVGLVGLAYLWDQKRNRELVFWCVPVAALLIPYFQNLTVGPTVSEIEAMGISLPTAGQKLAYFLDFLGSCATLGYFTDFLGQKYYEIPNFPDTVWLARTAGVAAVLGFAYLLARGYWRRNIVVFGLLTIILLGAVMAAGQRSSTLATSAFLSRYTINSVFMFGLLYLACAELHPRFFTRAASFSLIGAALFTFLSYRIALPYAVDHAADLRFTLLQSSNALTQGAAKRLPVGTLYNFNMIRKAVENGSYAIPESKTIQGLTSPSESVNLAALSEQILPWKLAGIGENSVAYTVFLAPTAEDSPVPGNAKVLFVSRDGQARAFGTKALKDLPGHDSELFGASPPGATHVVCVEKSALPGREFGVYLYQPDAERPGVSKTGLVVPTIWEAPAAFTSFDIHTVLHRQGHCLRTVEDPDGHCWVTTHFQGDQVQLPDAYAIEVLVRPTNVPGEKVTLIWALDSDPYAMRLVRDGDSFSLDRRDAKAWVSMAQFPAQTGAWQWIAVSAQKNAASMYSVAVSPDTGALSDVLAVPVTAPVPTPSGAATLLLGDAPDVSGETRAEVNELRISGGVLSQADITKHWPVLRQQ